MTQLILDSDGAAVTLPETHRRGYTAKPVPLSVDVEMVSGRMTRELRGNVWQVTYQYGFFTDEMKDAVIAACEKGKNAPIMCGFLAPTAKGELKYSKFLVTDFTYPDFMWSSMRRTDNTEYPVPLWADFRVTLREVKPSD